MFIPALLLFMLLVTTAGAVAFLVLRTPPHRPDAIGKSYALFCEKLNQAGLNRKSGMGPLDYAAFVGANRPDLARQFPLNGLFYHRCFGREAMPGNLNSRQNYDDEPYIYLK